jgi:MoxR-like ATPase
MSQGTGQVARPLAPHPPEEISLGWFRDPLDVTNQLLDVGYLADASAAAAAFLADRLGRPLLIEGPAGVGKTQFAKSLAQAVGAELIRLQCYEGLDEARALYEWNYKKQLLRIQSAGDGAPWDKTHDDIFTDEFLLPRPLLNAIRRNEPTVLLIDEVDKTDTEFEGLLLEVLSDFQVTVPELGTIKATRRPLVVLTSNDARELSEALRRRCLFLHVDYPTAAREREIVASHVPGIEVRLLDHLIDFVHELRTLELRKAPSIAESVDWARSLVAMNIGDLNDPDIDITLASLLKHQTDRDRAREVLLDRR